MVDMPDQTHPLAEISDPPLGLYIPCSNYLGVGGGGSEDFLAL